MCYTRFSTHKSYEFTLLTSLYLLVCFVRATQGLRQSTKDLDGVLSIEHRQSLRSFQYMCVDGLRWETNVAVTSRKWRHNSHLTPSQQPASGWYMAKIMNVLTRQTHVDKKPPIGLEATLFRRGKLLLFTLTAGNPLLQPWILLTSLLNLSC